MKALTIEEFEAICKYFHECGQKNIPFDEVYKDVTNGKVTTKPFYCKHGCKYGCSAENFGNECEQEKLWKEKNY